MSDPRDPADRRPPSAVAPNPVAPNPVAPKPVAPSAVALGVGAAVAVVVVLVVVLVSGPAPLVALGGSDPGVLLRIMTPLVRLVADAAAVVCVGSLVFAVAFTLPREASVHHSGPQSSGELSGRAWSAVLTAGRWAWVWAAAALLQVVLGFALSTGGLDRVVRLLRSAPSPVAILSALAAGEEPLAWLLTAVLAAVLAVVARTVLRWTSAVAVLALAVAAVLPPLATGHSSSQAGHDLAVPALWIHVIAAVVWLGVLVALVRPSWRSGSGAAPAAAVDVRYARLALWCWALIAASGVVDAAVLLSSPVALVTTPYGWTVLATAVLTLGVGELGRRWRGVRGRGSVRGRGRSLVGGELLLLVLTAGLSVAATVLVPPAWQRPTTALQTLLGYDLAGPPTVARLLLDWRPDLVLAPAAVLGVVAYLRATRRLRAAGEAWPLGRTVAWVAGAVVLLVTTSSGVGRYAAAMFSVHIAEHMVVSMLVPMLLVLGAPVVLLRRVRTSTTPGTLPGAADAVDALAGSWAGRLVARPIPVWAAFVVTPFAIYLTGLFDAAMRFRWAETLLDVATLAIGVAFARVTVGVAGPRPIWARLGLLLAAMPFGAVFAVVLATLRSVVGDGPAGANMYSSLALPWTAGRLLADQHVAAAIALGFGEVFLLLPIGVLLWRWDRGQRVTNASGGVITHEPDPPAPSSGADDRVLGPRGSLQR